MQEESIFTKIIKGDIPCHKIYEDESTIAFLDIHPLQPGHVLVVPKVQVETFLDLDEVTASALWSSARKVGKKLRASFPDKKRIALFIVGLDVDHVHIHLLPINSSEDYKTPQDMTAEPDHVALAKMAKKLAL